jgi:hypothetical protein
LEFDVTNDSKMKAAEAVAAHDALTGAHDPESDHRKADEILRAVVPASVDEAYSRLVLRARWWAHA